MTLMLEPLFSSSTRHLPLVHIISSKVIKNILKPWNRAWGSSLRRKILAPTSFHHSASLTPPTPSHEIKRCLLLGRKVMTNLDSILKSRDIALPTKVHLVKAMVFPVVMYGCENWIVKKAEHRRIDASQLWCWTRLLRVPWIARRSNQSILRRSALGFLWKEWC